jgi:hypothetical protein
MKAFANVVFSLATRNRFWFGMISRVSTAFSKFRDANFSKAHAALALEVEWLGDYTDCENAELTRGLGDNGRCPVPVPPPMPAVMNTMCAPVK